MKNVKNAMIGIVTGFANGLFGSGGGTIVVPCMEKFLGVETHKAHATAIAIILPLTIISAFVYLWGVEVEWSMVFFVCAGGVAGGYLGARFLNKVTGKMLHRIFGLFIIAAAVRMIF